MKRKQPEEEKHNKRNCIFQSLIQWGLMKEFVTFLFRKDVVSLVGAVPKLEDYFQKNPVWKKVIRLQESSPMEQVSSIFSVGVIATRKLDIVDNCPIPKWISMHTVTKCNVYFTWTDHISVLPRLRHLCLIKMVLNYENIKSLLKMHLVGLQLKDCEVEGKCNFSLIQNPVTIKTIRCFGYCHNVFPLFRAVRCSKLIINTTTYFDHAGIYTHLLPSPSCQEEHEKLDKLSSVLPDLETFVYLYNRQSLTFQKTKKWHRIQLSN